jgi:hypothetical protein
LIVALLALLALLDHLALKVLVLPLKELYLLLLICQARAIAPVIHTLLNLTVTCILGRVLFGLMLALLTDLLAQQVIQARQAQLALHQQP